MAHFGFKKINFAGGEPTLCPWLPELIRTAKKAGMATTIVTNGSMLTAEFLRNNKNYLDWIAISIDSISERTNLEIGRAIAGKYALSSDYYKSIVKQVKECGYGLKINTVVNRHNLHEDFAGMISYAKPKRWKIMQVLAISGQNDTEIEALTISDADFEAFTMKQQKLSKFATIVPERNTQMIGSYVMIDPAGRFFDNIDGSYRYSKSIISRLVLLKHLAKFVPIIGSL